MTSQAKPAYAVGYGKPPVGRPFKKGQSGNPRGRPRGARNLMTSLRAALDRKVVVTEGGRRRRIAKSDLGIGLLVDKFAQGDPAAAKLILGLLLEIERRAAPEPAERPPLEEADHIVIANLFARLRESVQGDGEGQPGAAAERPDG